MEKIICDRCGHEIRTEAGRVGLDVTFAGEYKGYDLCPSCGETFFHFLRTKPEEPDGQEFRRTCENIKQGLPPEAPIGARAADFDIGSLSFVCGDIPETTLRRMLETAKVESVMGHDEQGHPCRLWSMDEEAWWRLVPVLKKYKPRH